MLNRYHRWIFIHLEKTGGTSLTNCLETETAEPMSKRVRHWGIKEHIENYNIIPSDYFIFSIIRNPWDRLVSWYYHLLANNKFFMRVNNITCFNDLVKNLPDYIKSSTAHERYCINDNSLINYVLKYENLEQDVKTLSQKINLTTTDMPRYTHDTNRPRHIFYQDYYSTYSKDLVAELFQWEISMFNYKFEK